MMTLDTLDNGLRIATEVMPNIHSAAFAIAVNVGARHEDAGDGGLSHMLEHMAFKGTTKMNAKHIAEAFDKMGGNVNAYTSHEHTVYYTKVLKEYADEALELLCDIMRNSNFDQAELEREREVILQEIAMNHDSPDDLVFDMSQESSFGVQPLGRPILGKPERVSTFSRDDLIRYTQTHYQPNRITLGAAGAVDAANVKAIVGKYFNDLPKGAEPAVVEASHECLVKVLEKDLEQIQIVLGFPCCAVTHEDFPKTQVLSTILGGGMSSRLFQEIRERLGLAYSVSSFVSGYKDTGILGIYAGTTQEHMDELLVALRSVLRGLHDVSEDELLRAKNQFKAGLVMSRESSGRIAEWMARHLHIYGRVRSAEELLAEIDAITTKDIVVLAERYLSHPSPAIAAIGPHGSLTGIKLQERLAA
jgi:predicted Zn-dependent peptidase